MSDATILNTVTSRDPFVDADETDSGVTQSAVVHLRLRQRGGRQTLTTIDGLSRDHDLRAIAKRMQKKMACGASVEHDKAWGTVIKLQGDQRKAAFAFLVKGGHVNADKVVTHGPAAD